MFLLKYKINLMRMQVDISEYPKQQKYKEYTRSVLIPLLECLY